MNNLEKILGIETLIASQAIFITEKELPGFKLGRGTGAVLERIRRDFPGTNQDEYMPNQSGACIGLVEKRELLNIAEQAVGQLN